MKKTSIYLALIVVVLLAILALVFWHRGQTDGTALPQVTPRPAAAAPDPDAFREKVRAVLEIIESPDVDEAAKNQFLRSILEKIVYNKPDGSFDFYFAP